MPDDLFAGMPDYGDQRNRCATCGFFAVRAAGTSSISEATEANRTGAFFWQRDRPDCALGVVNLYHEVVGSRTKEEMRQVPENDRNQQIRAVVHKERDGTHWFPWRPHFSPTWHLERRDVLQLEESRRAHELRLSQIEVESRRSVEKIQADSLEIAKATQATMAGLRQIAQDSASTTDRTDRFMKQWTIAAVIVGVIALVVVLASYFYPDAGRELGRVLAAQRSALPALLLAAAVIVVVLVGGRLWRR